MMSCMARPVFWTVFGSSRHENSPSVRVKRVIELGLNFKGCFVRANKSHEVHAYAQLYKREAPRHLSYPQVSSWPNRKRWRRWLLSREPRMHACLRGPSARHLGVARIIKSVTREDMRRRTAPSCMAPQLSSPARPAV